MATAADSELTHWKNRALRAEAAAHFALWMSPLGSRSTGHSQESADDMAKRFRSHIEDRFPDLITRYEHRRTEVYQTAETCGCPVEDDDWEATHGESDETGHYLCEKNLLGYVCDSCENEDNGPDWMPDAVEWPCPPIAVLDRITPRNST